MYEVPIHLSEKHTWKDTCMCMVGLCVACTSNRVTFANGRRPLSPLGSAKEHTLRMTTFCACTAIHLIAMRLHNRAFTLPPSSPTSTRPNPHLNSPPPMMSRPIICFCPPSVPLRLAAAGLSRSLCTSSSSFLARDELRTARQSRIFWAPQHLPPPPSPVLALDAPRATAQKLDGKATAKTVRAEVAAEVSRLVSVRGENARPGLAVVIVGDRRDSQTYVRSKRKACEEVGITSFGYELPADCPQERLEEVVDELNARDDVHGILVQLPLPEHIDDEEVLDRIRLEKDVDGFHPLNIGRLCMSGRTPPMFVPCTPKGCVDLLDRYGVAIEGRNVVVIGRSNIVGLPLAMLLLHRNATVTICHSRTRDTEAKVRDADIVVAACGIPNFVKKDWLKTDAVVVDVGINAVDDPSKKRGYRLVGDVDYEGAAEVASYITPVPGGVGPMTIAMLLTNTLDACKRTLPEE